MEVRQQLFYLYKVMVCVERERERESIKTSSFFPIQDIHKNDKLVATTT